MPKVYNRYHGEVSLLDDVVYIGRPSKWGNPFVVNKHGTRDECVQAYREWMNPDNPLYAEAQVELRGRDLICFCKPLACHGDVLLEIANKEVRDCETKERIRTEGSEVSRDE